MPFGWWEYLGDVQNLGRVAAAAVMTARRVVDRL
jgi:hypothetical protein